MRRTVLYGFWLQGDGESAWRRARGGLGEKWIERERERREMDEDTGDIIHGGRTKMESDWRAEREGSPIEGKTLRIGVCMCMYGCLLECFPEKLRLEWMSSQKCWFVTARCPRWTGRATAAQQGASVQPLAPLTPNYGLIILPRSNCLGRYANACHLGW